MTKKGENETNLNCPSCGAKIKKDDKFCSSCGNQIQLEKKDNEKTESENIHNDEKTKDKKTKEENVKEEKVIEEIAAEDVEKIEKNPFVKETNNDLNNNTNSYEEVKQPIFENYNNFSSTSNSLNKTTVAKKNKYIAPVASAILTFVVCLLLFAGFYNYYLKNLVIETIKTEKEVTITDTGIAEAVSKVYDSVVVVETYYQGQLYATGTGFVYKTDDSTGYILTNAHVIENGTSVKVVFTNDESVEAEIVGSDSYSDIAVLAVDVDEVIAVAEIGSSEDLEVGDTAFAIGAPLDSSTYAWTVTRGIISGKNRKVSISSSTSNSTYVMEVLQTDAAINSGNSGGPLCNSNGEVIGITNMKLASSTIEGMGFAIPIETAVEYADKFISGENVSYPYLGISIYDASSNSYNRTNQTGIYIESVEDNSPADKAGLKSGDKITKINGEEVESTSYFKYELYKYSVGDKITITIERDGTEKEIEVTLGSNNTTT